MPDVGPEERWVGVDEVAAHLGVARDSVYRWVEKRGLPARRVGRLLRFKLSEVDAWVQAGGGEGNRPKESRTHARNPLRKKGGPR
jgi:excisionase family DNA binding protein